MPRLFTRRLLVVVLAMLLGWVNGCTPVIAKNGNMVEDADLAQVKIGESNREEVAKILGSPTQMGNFDDKIWYYIGRQTEKTAFWDPKLEKQKIVTITFTPEGKVASISQNGDENARAISPVDDKTPTYGKEMTVLQQMLGNIGKVGMPVSKDQH